MMEEQSNSQHKELTSDGIRQLFNRGPNIHQQEFVCQLTKLTEDYSGNKICYLSDGFCYVKAMIVDEARNKLIKGEIEPFDVVVLTREDVNFFGLEKDTALEIKNLRGSNIRMLCCIGDPVSYMMYFHNNFTNRKGCLAISEGQKVQNNMTLSQILEHYPHTPTKWVLKAKVVKKPERMNPDRPFMIVTLLDDQGSTIEGVFFGQVAIQNFARLSAGKQYIFSNGQIKTKRNSSENFQIKFTEVSQIIPIETTKTKPIEPIITAEDKVKNIPHNPGTLVSLTAKVIKIKHLNKGRSLSVIDSSADLMEVVLWEEFTNNISEGVTYQFENFRTKVYNANVTLQSMREKSKILVSENQLQISSNKTQDKKFSLVSKDIKDPDNILNVSEVLNLNVTGRLYKDVSGFLIINTTYMDTKNFFKVECTGCGGRDIGPSSQICRKCDAKNPIIRWNMRCHILDEKEDIKCIMNEELCEKLMKMSSKEGYEKLQSEPDSLKKIIDEISHLEGIFKVKLNPYNESIYYNILEIYKNDSAVLLKKAYKELKITMKMFVEKVVEK